MFSLFSIQSAAVSFYGGMLMDEKLLEVKLAIMEAIVWKLLMKNLISDKEYESIIELLRKEIEMQRIELINSKMN